MKIGCFQSNRGLRSMDYGAFATQAAVIGYDALDVPVTNPDAPALCETLGMEAFATSAMVPPDLSPDSARQEEIVDAVKKAIDDVAAMGLGVMTHLVGRDPSLSGDENIAIYKEVYTPIAAHAEEKEVRLAFENWPRNGTMLAITPELWDAMFNAVPSPAIGLCYDPSHLFWLSIDHIQPIFDFKDRIYHAHAKDTEILPKGQNQFGIYGRQLEATEPAQWWRYRLPGYGHINWYEYIDALYQVGYNDVLSVEHEDPVWDSTPELARRGLLLAYQFLTPLLA